MTAFDVEHFKKAIQRIVKQNPESEKEICDVMADQVELLLAKNPMLELESMAPITSALNPVKTVTSKRPLKSRHVLIDDDRDEVMRVILQVVTEAGEITWHDLRYKALDRLEWLIELQADPEATLRTWCAKLVGLEKLEYPGKSGKNNAPVNSSIIRLRRNGVEGDAAPFNGSGHALAYGTRSVARTDIEIMSDIASKGAKTEGDGHPSHRLNGSQNEPNTLPLTGHNSVFAGQ
jgi:hypothetical protein